MKFLLPVGSPMENMEVDGQPEQERPESHAEGAEEDSSVLGDTESVAESTEGMPGTSAEETAKDIVKFKLLSPMGGRSVDFSMVKGMPNRDVHYELHMHLTNIFKLGLGIKEAFEKSQGKEWQELPWNDCERVPGIITRLNKCISSVVSLWRGATRPHTESEWFQSPFCTAEQCKKLSFTIFNRVVKNAQVLNKCYKSFSSLTYGETSFDQIQIILDRLQMTEKDVFVDLGSGVGHVVTYASAYSLAKKCVGIEINNLPAEMATKMKKEFEGMMSWYGKKYRPFDLIHGDFLDEKHRKLIMEEATVIYINNFAFDPALMYDIKQMILDMPNGTRIICTKSLSEEREDRMRGEGEGEKKARPMSGRAIARQTVDIMLDCEELPLSEAPVSWSTGKGVQFLLFTVNRSKIQTIYERSKQNSSTASSSRSGSAESVTVPRIDDVHTDKSIAATIDEVVQSRGGAGSKPFKYKEEDDDDDDDDYETPGINSRKWAGLKTEKRRARDDEYVPKKRSSTSGSKHGKKENKKDKPSSRRSGAAAAASLSTSDAAVHAAMHNAIKDNKPKKEDGGRAPLSSRTLPDGSVILDPTNPMDAHLSKSSSKRGAARSIGGEPKPKKRRLTMDDKENRHSRSSSCTSSSTARSSMASSSMAPPVTPKPEDRFPYGKVAASGHTDNFDKADAPKWAGSEGRLGSGKYVGVFALHHSIFEEDLSKLPPRKRPSISFKGM